MGELIQWRRLVLRLGRDMDFGFLDLGVRMSCEPVRPLDDTQDME